jgi:chemotaxis protein MotB
MAKRKPIEAPGIPEWVLTYGDLMSLLLTFFILLAAFSELKKEEDFQKVLEGIREAFGNSGGKGAVPSDEVSTNAMVSALAKLANYADDKGRLPTNDDNTITGRQERTTTIREGEKFAIGGSLPFDAGDAKLSEDVKARILADVVPKIQGRTDTIEIRGHAWGAGDVTPSRDLRDLSYQRARAVFDYLVTVGEIDPSVLTIVARGDQEPASMSGVAEGGFTQNRRVQILLTEESADERRPDPNMTGQPN